MPAVMDTPHLRLRPFTAADAGHLYALDNDAAVMRYINGGQPVPMAVIEDEILPVFMQRDPAQPQLGFWAAEDRATGEWLGWFSLRPSGIPGELALGYRLRSAVWGRGYATEGGRALLAQAFDELDATRVVATTYEENLASRRVMEKLGMQLARRFRYTPEDLAATGTFYAAEIEVWAGDDVAYSIEANDWNGASSGD